jgi:hypothetical protein
MDSSTCSFDESGPFQPKFFLGDAEKKSCDLRRLIWQVPESWWKGSNSVSREDMLLSLEAIQRVCAYGKTASVEEANDCASFVEDKFNRVEQQIDRLLASRSGCV